MKRGILYTFVYILMTIVSVIGTIAINALLPGSDTFGTPTDAVFEVSAGEKVLTNMLAMGPTAINAEILFQENTDVKSKSILANDIEQISNDIVINFTGNINISSLDNGLGSAQYTLGFNNDLFEVTKVDTKAVYNTMANNIKFTFVKELSCNGYQ